MKGQGGSMWAIAIGIASVITAVFLFGGAIGNFWQAEGESFRTGAVVAGTRITQASELLGTGLSHSFLLNLSGRYDEIVLSEGEIVFRKDGEDDVTVKRSTGVENTVQDASEVCIRTSGGDLELRVGECMPEPCLGDECVRKEGQYFVCSGGAFELSRDTDMGSCGTGGQFYRKTFFSCPDTVETGEVFTCSAGYVYNCSEDSGFEVVLESGQKVVPKVEECTGEVERGAVSIEIRAGSRNMPVFLELTPEGFGEENELRKGVRVS